MCPLVNEVNVRKNKYETVVTVTGQHREMLDQILRVFDIAPHHDLAIMKPGQTLFDVTFDVLLKFKSVLEGERPRCCVCPRRHHDQLRRRTRLLLLADPRGTRRGRPSCARHL